MTAPTIQVTVSLEAMGGPAIEGVQITATLDVNERYEDAIVIAKPVTLPTGADGKAVFDLFPNLLVQEGGLGTQGSTYRFTASVPGGRPLDASARFPNADSQLEDWLVQDDPLLNAFEQQSVVLARGWANKADGQVDGVEYSAKEYAQGSQAATGGSAKHWAQEAGPVTGAGANDRSAKSWAQSDLSGATLGGSSKDWSQKTNGTVDGASFSAKEHASGSQAGTGGSSKNWAQQTGADVTGAAVNSRSSKSWAQEDLTPAGQNKGGSAKDWATSASLPDGVNKSAKSYVADAAGSAGAAAGSAGAAAGSAGAAAGSAGAAAGSAGAAAGSAGAAAGSATLAQDWATKTAAEVVVGQGFGAKKYAIDASNSAAAAGVSAGQAASASATAGAYPNGAGANVPRGLTQASVGAITPGAGGTNGTFALAWAGGNFAINPTGTFTVAGGVLTAVTITGPGLYIGAAPAVPAPSFAASAGLAGAAVVLTAQFLVTAGQGYWVTSADGKTLDRYNNVAGVATRDATVASVPANPVVTDEILKSQASLGDAYTLGAPVTIGSTAANTTDYPGGFTDLLLPPTGTATRGYLNDFSVRMSAAGTGQIIVLTPDPMAPYDFDVAAVVAVAPAAAGINTWQGSQIYAGELPAGSRVGYRILTGGVPRYVGAGGACPRLQTTAQVAGTAMNGNLIVTTHDYAVSFSIRPVAAASLDARVTKVEGGTHQFGIDLAAMFGANVTGSSVTTGNTGLAVTGVLPTGDWVYALAPVAQACILESVTLPVANPFASGDITLAPFIIAIGEVNAVGAIIVTHLYTVQAAEGKTNVITGFGNLLLPAGAFVMVQARSAQAPLNYQAGTTGGTYTVNHGAALTMGATVALGAYVNTPIFSFSVRQATNSLGPRVTTLEGRQALLMATSNPIALERTEFPGVALPSGWAASGAWTVNNGLTPPAAGGWGVKALNGVYSSLWKHNQIARIKINHADTITGLAQSPPENSGGAALIIDGVAGKLRLYSWDDTGAAGTLQAEVALPAALVAGREYVLKLDKVGFTITGTFKDTVTQASCTVNIADASGSYTMAHGKCGALFISATTPPNYQWLEYLAPYARKCRALIIADSIGEAAYLGAASPSWAQQVATARAAQNDIVIAPRAGDETPNFLLRKGNDWDIWLPQFAVIALGTNDGDTKIAIGGFTGANKALHPKLLGTRSGVDSLNQKPGRGDLRPWRCRSRWPRCPAARQTIYRFGRDVKSDANYWFSWNTVVHAVRGYNSEDATERTYFTGSGAPKWTDNTIAIAGAPFPTATRTLGVPAPVSAGDRHQQQRRHRENTESRYYTYTYVNAKGDESAPAPGQPGAGVQDRRHGGDRERRAAPGRLRHRPDPPLPHPERAERGDRVLLPARDERRHQRDDGRSAGAGRRAGDRWLAHAAGGPELPHADVERHAGGHHRQQRAGVRRLLAVRLADRQRLPAAGREAGGAGPLGAEPAGADHRPAGAAHRHQPGLAGPGAARLRRGLRGAARRGELRPRRRLAVRRRAGLYRRRRAEDDHRGPAHARRLAGDEPHWAWWRASTRAPTWASTRMPAPCAEAS
jgi:hypothetical protein